MKETSKDHGLTMEFRRRRRTWLRYVFVSTLFMTAGLGLGFGFRELPRWISFSAFFAGFLVATISTRAAKYRCPRCDTVPLAGEGWALNPAACERCRLQF
jgi:hypothetical protein